MIRRTISCSAIKSASKAKKRPQGSAFNSCVEYMYIASVWVAYEWVGGARPHKFGSMGKTSELSNYNIIFNFAVYVVN